MSLEIMFYFNHCFLKVNIIVFKRYVQFKTKRKSHISAAQLKVTYLSLIIVTS
jgi:hypothetical protein